jgi:MFS family permease
MRRLLMLFLVVFVAINFADKAIFGLSAAQIMSELRLSNAQFGAIGGCFFALFSIAALLVGGLGDRRRAAPLLAGLGIVWSAAQVLAILSTNAAALVVSRVLLGAGEGPAFPLALHVSFGFIPERARARATGFLLAGAPLGTALAALLLTPVLVRFGWRSAYAVLALLSLMWAAVWIAIAPKAPAEQAAPPNQQFSWRALFGNRRMSGAMFASFVCYFSNTIGIVWYPKFFETGAGVGATSTGSILAVVWASQIPVCIFAGLAISRLASSRSDTATFYGRCGVGALVLVGLSFVGLTATQSLSVVVASAVMSLVASVVVFVAFAPLVAELAPAGMRAAALGAYAAVYSLGGAFGPWLFGVALDLGGGGSDGFRLAFTSLGAFTLAASLVAALLILPGRSRNVMLSPESAEA